MNKKPSLAGVCGLYCGLCTKHYAKTPCPGCGQSDHCLYCSIYRCAANKNVISCADCKEYPCEKIARVTNVGPDGTSLCDDYITLEPCHINILTIMDEGIDNWIKRQEVKRKLLGELIDNFDEGRSKTFYSTVVALMPEEEIKSAIKETKREIAKQKIGENDLKNKAKFFRGIVTEKAKEKALDLTLRKKISAAMISEAIKNTNQVMEQKEIDKSNIKAKASIFRENLDRITKKAKIEFNPIKASEATKGINDRNRKI